MFRPIQSPSVTTLLCVHNVKNIDNNKCMCTVNVYTLTTNNTGIKTLV